jgi:hypothetical protein
MDTSWLELLKTVSLEWRSPLARPDWEAVEARVVSLPPDLRLLYQATNGVRLPAGLKLFPLLGRSGEASTLVLSKAGGVWHFGRMGERVQLFAAQKEKVHRRGDGAALPEWVVAASAGTWVYGMRHTASAKTLLFASLPALLTGLLPDWLAAKAKEEEPEFAKSSDVQLVSSASLEIDIEVVEPVEVRGDSPPDAATTEKVKLPPRRPPSKKKRKAKGASKPRRGK